VSENPPLALTQAVESVRTASVEKLSGFLRQAPEIVQLDTPEADTLLGLACRLATGNVAIPAYEDTFVFFEKHALSLLYSLRGVIIPAIISLLSDYRTRSIPFNSAKVCSVISPQCRS
jgi:hypothetical protein